MSDEEKKAERQRLWDEQRAAWREFSTNRRLEIEKGAAEERHNGGLSNDALLRRLNRTAGLKPN